MLLAVFHSHFGNVLQPTWRSCLKKITRVWLKHCKQSREA